MTVQHQRGDSRISIHAPRTGSDFRAWARERQAVYFNPRSPHGERRGQNKHLQGTPHFNPRSPHGERPVTRQRRRKPPHFNPRSPHGERLQASRAGVPKSAISIHAPRTGSDRRKPNPPDECRTRFQSTLPARGATSRSRDTARIQIKFQSTLPARGATGDELDMERCDTISIHAPRTGSDALPTASRRRNALFQSTLPARGATTFC